MLVEVNMNTVFVAVLLALVQLQHGLDDLIGQVMDDMTSSQKITKSGAAVFILAKRSMVSSL